MLRSIYRRIAARIFGTDLRPVEFEVGGRVVLAQRGTIPKNVDKDDAWFAALVKDVKVIFDVGANVGYTGLLAHLYGTPRQIVMVDPNPLALSFAARNAIINGFSQKCSFVLAFIADKRKESVKFYTVGTGAAGSIFPEYAKSASKSDSWYMVQTETLNALIDSMGSIPDLIKIDVEGAEHSVLMGAREVCGRHKPKLMVEMHSGKTMSMLQNCQLVLDWCTENDYTAWYMAEHCKLIKPEQIAHRGRCHLLLLPIQQEYPSVLKTVKQGDHLPRI